MIWDNDGSASDVINCYAEMFGDGVVMDALIPKLIQSDEQRALRERREIAEVAARVNEARERRVHAETGLVPDFSVPVRLYHGYAAATRLRCQEQGIELEQNGYEIWQDADFQQWFKRRYPELCFKEAQRNARIIVNEGRTLTTTAAA